MRNLGMAVALGAAVAWGYVYATTQEFVEKLPPIATLAMIYWLGTLLLLPVGIWYGPEIFHSVQEDTRTTASLMLSVLLAEFFIIWSISLLGGVDAGLVEITYPVWTLAFLYILKDQPPTRATLVGAALVVAGLVVIARK